MFYCMFAGFTLMVLLLILYLGYYKLLEEHSMKVFLANLTGWDLYLFWIALWFSPQPRYYIAGYVLHRIPILNILVGAPILTLGAWLGITGVKQLSLRTSLYAEPRKQSPTEYTDASATHNTSAEYYHT